MAEQISSEPGPHQVATTFGGSLAERPPAPRASSASRPPPRPRRTAGELRPAGDHLRRSRDARRRDSGCLRNRRGRELGAVYGTFGASQASRRRPEFRRIAELTATSSRHRHSAGNASRSAQATPKAPSPRRGAALPLPRPRTRQRGRRNLDGGPDYLLRERSRAPRGPRSEVTTVLSNNGAGAHVTDELDSPGVSQGLAGGLADFDGDGFVEPVRGEQGVAESDGFSLRCCRRRYQHLRPGFRPESGRHRSGRRHDGGQYKRRLRPSGRWT